MLSHNLTLQAAAQLNQGVTSIAAGKVRVGYSCGLGCFCCCLLADLCLLLHFLQPGCERHDSLLKLHTAQPNNTATAAAAAAASQQQSACDARLTATEVMLQAE
jgi:hypothetical protein